MSSANKDEHGELEQSMWRRFQDAEVTPGPDVWSRIDHALALQENTKYKKRALFYRQLAAACLVLFILAGSALLLHYKQDQENSLLATTANEQHGKVATTGSATPGSGVKKEAPIVRAATTEPDRTQAGSATAETNITYTEQPATAALAYTSATAKTSSVASVPRSKTKAAAVESNNRAGTIPVSVDAGDTGLLAVTDQKTTSSYQSNFGDQGSYLPASQAIANVPDSYTSPSALNPLLRRNASLGSLTEDNSAAARLEVPQQPEPVLALNTSSETGNEKKSDVRSSRWNVGMGITSSYFSQNVDIPEQRLMANQGFGVARQMGPVVSAETEENLVKAYEEFENNTRAASSFNVDARAGFRLGKRLKLLTGLGYSQNTSRTKTSYIVEQFVNNPRTNERNKLQPSTVFLPSIYTFTTDSVSVVKTKEPFDVDYSYQMLSVPLGVQVEGNLGQKWYWYAMGSTAVNFLMQTTIKAANPEIASVTYGPADDSPFRKVQLSGNAGMGLGRRLSNAVSLSFGPEFRTYFNSLLNDEKAVATQGRPYTLGLNMAINYTLHQGSK